MVVLYVKPTILHVISIHFLSFRGIKVSKKLFEHYQTIFQLLPRLSMSPTLDPTPATVAGIQLSIQGQLKSGLPTALLVDSISPLLATVNKWQDHIPLLLEGNAMEQHANIIFSIRKDLFQVPNFTQSTFGPVLNDLPASFKDFVAFTYKLIEAQKPAEADKASVKVFFFW